MSQVIEQKLPEDQISPKALILKIVSIKDSVIKNWKLILILTLIGYSIGYALDIYLKKEESYEANILFNLGGGSTTQGLGDMAGLLGLGSQPDANIFTGENFFHFILSRPVVERALMKEIEFDSKKMLFANFYMDSSAIRKEKWKKNERLQTFHFTKNVPSEFDLEERLVLNDVVERIKSNTAVSQPDRKSSFIQIQVTVEDPILAKTWANTLLETVEEVYTENQTSKTRKTLNLLKSRADSLGQILGRTESRLAKQIDYSQSIIAPEGKVQVNKLQRNTEFVTQLYMEALRNVENMKVSLVREAPLFTIIEPVKEPVDGKSDTTDRAQIGILIGLVLALITIYIKGVYSDIMADQRV